MAGFGLGHLDAHPRIEVVLRQLAAEAGAASAFVSLIWSEEVVVFAAEGSGQHRIDRAESVCAHALSDPDSPLLIPDARYDPRTMDSTFVLGAPFVRSYAGKALGIVPDLPFGVVFLTDPQPRRFTPAVFPALDRAARAIVEKELAATRAH